MLLLVFTMQFAGIPQATGMPYAQRCIQIMMPITSRHSSIYNTNRVNSKGRCMSIFAKLFGSKDADKAAANVAKGSENVNAANISSVIPNAPSNATEQDLIERYAGIVFDKQTDLYEAIGDNAWNADLEIGEISFGDGKNYAVQTLGTYSHSANTWLWAWANDKADWPDSVLIQARQLKAYGEANRIDILSNSSFGTTMADVHLIGLIASGVFGASAYYIADYGQGAMLFTITTDKLMPAKNEHARVITVIPQMISAYEMNHMQAITHYLNAKNYVISHDKNTMTGIKHGNIVIVEFDEQNRLISLNGQIKN
jgi:hypothetical protein